VASRSLSFFIKKSVLDNSAVQTRIYFRLTKEIVVSRQLFISSGWWNMRGLAFKAP
jgi:hypothetical protein